MSAVKRLEAMLKESGRRIAGITRGTREDASTEEIAEELIKAIESLDRGEYELSMPVCQGDEDHLTAHGREAVAREWKDYYEQVAERDRLRAAWAAKQAEST